MKGTVADRRRLAILAFAYCALPALAVLAYATAHLHVGALAVIPILFISYYLRPPVALATAFVTGIVLGLDQSRLITERAFDVPIIADAVILSVSLCTVVVVTNRLREMHVTNELLRGSLVKARRAAEHDVLTGLPNRAYFMHALDEAVGRATPEKRAALLFCDLDGFKRVNDSYGHVIGDGVLRMAASRLVNTVRAVDVVARIGGDEFAVLAQHVDAGEAAHMATNIERAFADPFHAEGRAYELGITVGIALCPGDGSDASALLNVADARMYRAKAEKRSSRT